MANCFDEISKSVLQDCTAQEANGYTGRAVILQWKDNPDIAVNALNSNMLTSIELPTGKKGIQIDNTNFIDPFTGSNYAANTDDGARKILKTFVYKVPLKGSAVSKKLLEGMFFNNFGGSGAIVVAEKIVNGVGKYPVIGYKSPFLINPDGLKQDEYADGGAYILTGSCKERAVEVELYDTDVATTKAAFEALLANCYNA